MGGAAVLLGRRRLNNASWPVSRVLYGGRSRATAIPLGRRLPAASRYLPERWPGNRPAAEAATAPIRYCSRWGLPCRSCCQSRGGLLPHRFTLTRPYSTRTGGLFSVALSLGSPPPGVTRHRASMEPGLSSPAAFRPLPERPSGQLTALPWGCGRRASRSGAGTAHVLVRTLVGY